MSDHHAAECRPLTPRALVVRRHLLVHGPESEALDSLAGVGRPRQILSAVRGKGQAA